MSKTVFLILYLWHADVYVTYGGGHNSPAAGMNGGSVLQVKRMDSLRQCEAVGAAIKALADAQPHSTQPAAFRCIEVAR